MSEKKKQQYYFIICCNFFLVWYFIRDINLKVFGIPFGTNRSITFCSWQSAIVIVAAIDLHRRAIVERLKYSANYYFFFFHSSRTTRYMARCADETNGGGSPRYIGNPWERRNLQESHPTVFDGTVRYRGPDNIKLLGYLRNLMPREPVFGARDRIFLPRRERENIPPRKPPLFTPAPFPGLVLSRFRCVKLKCAQFICCPLDLAARFSQYFFICICV